jgi:hypothetical protein
MKKLLVLLLALCVPALMQCQARRDLGCLAPAQPMSAGTQFDLPDSVGRIRLPPRAVSEPLGSNPHGRKFILEDSTVLEIWVTPEPAVGLAATGGTAAETVQSCDTRIGRFTATVTRAALGSPNQASVFVGLLNIILDQKHALNVAVTTATAPSRDAVLNEVPTFLQLR